MKSVSIPHSKSLTNRALFLAALGDTEIELSGALFSEDTEIMINCLNKINVQIFHEKNNNLRIVPPKKFTVPIDTLFVGNAGTVARFFSAMSLLVDFEFTIDGVPRMRDRPFADLFLALQDLGVTITNNNKCLPATFCGVGGSVMPSEIFLSGRISSQFISALMMVATRLPNGLVIRTDNIPARPYIEMTMELIRIFGGRVKSHQDFTLFEISPNLQSPTNYAIPTDCSAASYPMALSLLTCQPFKISNFGSQTLQGDEQFIEILERCGAKISRKNEALIIVPPKTISPIGNFDFSAMPDVSMTAMILASVSEGISIFTGLESLRVKECDRIEAMRQGFEKLGIHVQITDDTMHIEGGNYWIRHQKNFAKILVNSFDDHRIAMCFGLLQQVFNLDFQISNPSCVAKTWPNYWKELASWNNNLRSVAGIIVRDKISQNFLLVKKDRSKYAWQFPQGGVEAKESLLMAAQRELAEECGEDLRVIFQESPLGEYRYLFPEDFERWNENISGAEVTYFMADYVSGEVVIDDVELCDFAWVDRKNFAKFFEKNYLENMEKILERA